MNREVRINPTTPTHSGKRAMDRLLYRVLIEELSLTPEYTGLLLDLDKSSDLGEQNVGEAHG